MVKLKRKAVTSVWDFNLRHQKAVLRIRTTFVRIQILNKKLIYFKLYRYRYRYLFFPSFFKFSFRISFVKIQIVLLPYIPVYLFTFLLYLKKCHFFKKYLPCLFNLLDLFFILRHFLVGSGFSKKVRIRPDPQHCLKGKRKKAVERVHPRQLKEYTIGSWKSTSRSVSERESQGVWGWRGHDNGHPTEIVLEVFFDATYS